MNNKEEMEEETKEERIERIRRRRDEMRAAQEWSQKTIESRPSLPVLLEDHYIYEIYTCSPILKWVQEHFPLDGKMYAAWIEWSKVENCKRWFPREDPESEDLKLQDIVDEFQLQNAEVWTDTRDGLLMKTNMEYMLELHPDELPYPEKHIWNEDDKWIIEITNDSKDYSYSVNFGYSDSNWKIRNYKRFAELKRPGFEKYAGIYIDETDTDLQN